MSYYFPERKSLGKVKVSLDLSNYATKAHLKNATGVDTSSVAKKIYLADLKSDVDKLDIHKLKNLTFNSSNLKSKVDIRKNIFDCLFSVHNAISLSCHEQVCLIRLPFERYFSHHRETQMIMSHIFKGNMLT